ncbi:MAG: hypothetical protein JO269_01925 [Burkholderiaceae bacterium]|nr:hypothetical protein [Burkholderiaceae bacterium]
MKPDTMKRIHTTAFDCIMTINSISCVTWRLLAKLGLLALPMALAGCGVMAAPCRVASVGLKMIPVVGHAAAVPTDACAEIIDP